MRFKFEGENWGYKFYMKSESKCTIYLEAAGVTEVNRTETQELAILSFLGTQQLLGNTNPVGPEAV